jgi:hypothetical protein
MAATREAQTAIKCEELKQWLAEKHPDIPYNEATKRAFQEDMGNAFLVATDADFEYSLNTSATTFSRQRVPTQEEVTAAENKRRRALSLPELQDLARFENPEPTRDPLPAVWFGADISTAEGLRRLAARNITSFRALTSRYGHEAVNARLGATKQKQVGQSINLDI